MQSAAFVEIPREQFRVYPQRFQVVLLFGLVQMMTSVLLNTLTPIAAFLADIYDLDPVIINLGALLFALMHPVFTFPAAFVIDKYGTRAGIRLGCVLCFIGTSLRLLVNQGFYWVIIGQVIAGIGRPFILNCQAKIGANWFTAKVRGGVTQILTLVLNVSLILGIFIPKIVFGSYDPMQDGFEKGRELTFNVMLVEAIMGVFCYGLNILFQIDKPPTPPSDSGSVVREPFKVAIPKLFRNRNYVLLLIAFGCYFGIFNGISVILSYLLEPWFGGDQLTTAVVLVGGSPIISGILGVIIIGPRQRKSEVFKKWIIFCMIGSSLAIVLFYPLLETGILGLVIFISAFNSFFLIPLVPIMLELGCEIAFPVGQGSAVGMLFATGNFAGFLLGLFLSMIVQGESRGQSAGGLGFCFGMFLIGIALIYFMKEETNRSDYERASSEKRKSERQSVLESNSSDRENLQAKLLTNTPSKKIEDALL